MHIIHSYEIQMKSIPLLYIEWATKQNASQQSLASSIFTDLLFKLWISDSLLHHVLKVAQFSQGG